MGVKTLLKLQRSLSTVNSGSFHSPQFAETLCPGTMPGTWQEVEWDIAPEINKTYIPHHVAYIEPLNKAEVHLFIFLKSD